MASLAVDSMPNMASGSSSWMPPNAAAESMLDSSNVMGDPNSMPFDLDVEDTPSMSTARTSRSSFSSIDLHPATRRTRRETRKKKKPEDTKTIHIHSEAEDDQENMEDDEDDGPPGARRDKLLARNRVAASKCRQKKKVWVHDLEDAKYDLEAQHSTLQVEYNGLLDEVTQMKFHLMLHANCNDNQIDRWIGDEAQRFVDRTVAQQGQEERRFSGSLSGSDQLDSRRGSLYQLASSNASLPPSPQVKFEPINFDHMPDDMFADIPEHPGS